MKKSKIERIIYEDSWCPQIDDSMDWEDFKRLAEERIQHSISNGYSNPKIRYNGGWDHSEILIFLTKLEDDAVYLKRKSVEEAKLEKAKMLKIEKLKKEAKELGLKVV